jgi:hypothetical protein
VRLPDEQQIVELFVDEVLVPLEIALVDIDSGRKPEEALEPGDAHDWHDPSFEPWNHRHQVSPLWCV